MNRGDIERLLGGYATGTLTPAEQQALFEAALEDQELFDTLAREEALREMFRDPAVRAELLADERPARWYEGWMAWRRPAAAAFAVAALTLVVFVTLRKQPEKPPAQILADARTPAHGEEHARELERPSAQSSMPQAPASPGPRRVVPPVRDSQDQLTADKKVRANIAAENEAKLEAAPSLKEKDAANALAKADVPAEPKTAAAPPLPPASQTVVVTDGAVPQAEPARRDARSLYYAAPPAVTTQSFAQAGQQGGLASARQEVQQQKGEPASQAEQKQQQQPAGNQQTARSMAGLASNLPGRVPYAGLKYKIQRRREDGAFEEADPGSLKTGDVVKLQFTPNDGGRLVVMSGKRTVMSLEVERLRDYYTPPLNPDDLELQVTFTRGLPPGTAGGGRPATVVYQTVSSDNFVVNTASTPLQFTIRLSYK